MKKSLFFAIIADVDIVPLAEQQKVDAMIDICRDIAYQLQVKLDLLELPHKVRAQFQLDGSEPVNILTKAPPNAHSKTVKDPTAL